MNYSDYRRIGRENLSGKWALAVGTAFVAALLGGSISGSGGSFNLEIDAEMIQSMPDIIKSIITAWISISGLLGLVTFIIGGTVELGYAQFLLKQHDNQNPEFNDLFSQFHRFKDGFIQSFLRGIYVSLWSLLFIIPGIIKAYSYFMTPFIMIDNPSLTPRKAITESCRIMDGNKADLFILELTFIGWSILCLFTLGIGNLFLTPYMNATFTAFYRDISRSRPVDVIDV